MGFNKFTWIDRNSEYPDRRIITDTSTGVSQLVTMTRNEGIVTEQGTAFSANNMNNLEDRIGEMFPVSVENIKIKEIIDLIYPIGAIYMSVNGTNPSVLFGGTWEQIQDKFLLSAGGTYSAGSEGGESEHTLTVSEMPVHSHKISDTTEKRWSSESGGWATFRCGSDNIFGGDIFTQSAGQGQSHNNMPPYLAVYVWKRTA